jgi:hypothetical protein
VPWRHELPQTSSFSIESTAEWFEDSRANPAQNRVVVPATNFGHGRQASVNALAKAVEVLHIRRGARREFFS